jgi:hypothetical protein
VARWEPASEPIEGPVLDRLGSTSSASGSSPDTAGVTGCSSERPRASSRSSLSATEPIEGRSSGSMESIFMITGVNAPPC